MCSPIFGKTLYKLRWALRLLAYFTNNQNNRIDGAVCWTQRVLFQLLENIESPVALKVLSPVLANNWKIVFVDSAFWNTGIFQ